MKIFRRPSDGVAAGDAIPFYWKGVYHLFYLTSPAGTKKYPERVRTTWRHAVSKDLVVWEELPIALSPGEEPECDSNGVWTGSVIYANDKFHIFYTGYHIASDFPQTICHATSNDLINWEKDEKNPIIKPDINIYENIDWRDPYVFWNEGEQCYWMILSARLNKGPDSRRGCIALATSDDLDNWTVHDPIYAPYSTNCPECPEMYKMGDKWYLAYSRFSESAQTIYRIADNPRGPWRAPIVDGLDGRRFYAAKSLEDDNKRRFYFGWVHDRENEVDNGEWEWGGDFTVPREVIVLPNNDLAVKCPEEITRTYNVRCQNEFNGIMGKWTVYGTEVLNVESLSKLSYGFFNISQEEFLFQCKITPTDVRDSFGILIKSDKELETGYILKFEPSAQRVSLVKLPQPMDPFWSTLSGKTVPLPEADGPRVVERPLLIDNNSTLDCKVIVTDTIIEVFVNDKVALSYRAYDKGQHQIGLIVEDGYAQFSSIEFKKQMN
ncbi:glycoside hydrolase family 32 protein [Bacillus sp. Marseille-P3661]|uniref:glycoside hydrolase family 32 protein n=1 Tax=Bacillus sp. Marseille-P3661 TaxID=1936234 RepID=UPI000C831662|nr:glycoside hydrolase family 32 protein [Bacillus sp. Marseille-P3661]